MCSRESIVRGARADNRTQKETWPRSERAACTHRSTLFIPGQTLRSPEREFNTRGEEALWSCNGPIFGYVRWNIAAVHTPLPLRLFHWFGRNSRVQPLCVRRLIKLVEEYLPRHRIKRLRDFVIFGHLSSIEELHPRIIFNGIIRNIISTYPLTYDFLQIFIFAIGCCTFFLWSMV